MRNIDFRTRFDSQLPAVDFTDFHEQLVQRLRDGDSNGPLAARAIERLGVPPLAIEVGGRAYTYAARAGTIEVIPGRTPDAIVAPMDEATFAEIVLDLRSITSALLTGRLRVPLGTSQAYLHWEIVLRALLDGRALYEPGAVEFLDRDGGPLELQRIFTTADDPAEMSHFVRETGYLILRGLFAPSEMAELSADIDRAASAYRPGDGRSWWVRTADGQRLVRLKDVQQTSPFAAALIRDPRFLSLADLCPERYPREHCVPGGVDACIKPVGTLEGISDMTWHKDCSLGRHSYDCCHLGIGFAVTDANPECGQLCVVAGSHRTQIPLIQTPSLTTELPAGLDLPIVPLTAQAGDVAIHLGCVLHMSRPPQRRERRVVYAGFDLVGAGRVPFNGDHYAAMKDPASPRPPQR